MRPVLVERQRPGLGMTDRLDAKEVAHLSFETSRGKRQVGKGRDAGMLGVEEYVEFEALVGRAVDKEVDDANGVVFVAGADEREAVPAVE